MFQFGREAYGSSKPYARAAPRVTSGFMNTCCDGCARKPNTVTSGQVSTRVCLRGSDATVSTQLLNRLSTVPVPYRKSCRPNAKAFAPSGARTASRNAIFSNEKIMLCRDCCSTRIARAAISAKSCAASSRVNSALPSAASQRRCDCHL